MKDIFNGLIEVSQPTITIHYLNLLTQHSNRSQDMDLFQIQIHKDESWEVMNAFGKLGKCQFIDLNVLKQPHELLFTNNLRNMD